MLRWVGPRENLAIAGGVRTTDAVVAERAPNIVRRRPALWSPGNGNLGRYFPAEALCLVHQGGDALIRLGHATVANVAFKCTTASRAFQVLPLFF